jgi:hypothetical protein
MTIVTIVNSPVVTGTYERMDRDRRRASRLRLGYATWAIGFVKSTSLSNDTKLGGSNTIDVKAIVRDVAGEASSLKIDFTRDRKAASDARSQPNSYNGLSSDALIA